MKRVLLYLGMGSCVSSEDHDQRSEGPHSSMKIINWSSVSTKSSNSETPPSTVMGRPISVQTPVSEVAGSKEELFFDTKPWLDSDDEDFVSVYGDTSPVKQVHSNGDQQGRKLCELFLDSSFGSDSQISLKANAVAEANGKEKKPVTMNLERKKSERSAKRCLPSLVRSLSCGDRKKRLSPVHIAAVG